MRRELAKFFACFANIDTNRTPELEVPEIDLSKSDLDLVLDEIFKPDPVSGLPKGDLAYYLSPDGNPNIKAWLENNLLQPRALRSGSTMEGVTDDMIHEMQRQDNESVEDYISRLNAIRNEVLPVSNNE